MDHLLTGILFFGGLGALLIWGLIWDRAKARKEREAMIVHDSGRRAGWLLPLAIFDGFRSPGVGGHSDGGHSDQGHSSGDAGGGDGGGGSDH